MAKTPRAAVLAGFGWLGAAWGCEQSAFECTVAHGSFAARYTLIDASGDCAPRRGEIIGVQQYEVRNGDKLEYGGGTLFLQADAMAALAGAAEGPVAQHEPFARGRYASEKPEAGVCSVPELSPAVLELSEPARSLRYEWSQVRVPVTAESPGQRFSAELTTVEDGCTVSYRVSAVFPAVFCGEPSVPPEPCDESTPCAEGACVYGTCVEECDESAACSAGSCVGGLCLIANAALCATEADPAAGLALGSGINPDFAVECDPELMLCVLAEAVR